MNGILSAAMLKKELELVKAELQLIKDNQLSGDQKVQLSGTMAMNNRPATVIGHIKKLAIPTYDGSNQPVHPSVVYIPKGFGPAGKKYKYWMAMTPYPKSTTSLENPSIVASNDLETWEVPPGMTNPIVAPLTPPAYNRDPELVYDGSKLLLYWQDSFGKSYRKTLTNNSSTWSASEEVFGLPTAPAIFYREQGDYVSWGQSNRDSGVATYRKARSVDGINWVSEGYVTTNLLGVPGHISVFANEGGFHFLAHMFMRDNWQGTRTELYYGFSQDGSYIQFDTTPLLHHDESTDWMSNQIYRACMIYGTGQTYTLFFSAKNDAEDWSIGKASLAINNPSSLLDFRGKSHEIVVFNNVEMRNNTLESPYLMAWRQYKHKRLWVFNTLDKPVSLEIIVRFKNRFTSLDALYKLGEPNGDNRLRQRVDLASGAYHPYYISSDLIPALDELFPVDAKLRIQAGADTPTSGAITVILVGYND